MSFREVTLDTLIEPAPLERAGERHRPILSMTMHHGLVDQTAKFKKRVASADTKGYKLVRKNQLVVGFPIDEGVLSFQDLYDEAIVSPAYDVWKLRSGIAIDSAYLERFLRAPRALEFYRAKLRGTTARRRSLPDDIFLSLSVPLPALAEQRRIAEILETAEMLPAKRRAALAQGERLRHSIFLAMFGDPILNDRGWPRIPLNALGTVERGVSKHRPRNSPELLGGPHPFVQTGDVANCDGYVRGYAATYSDAGLRQSKMWPAGTLCITIAANIARTGILTFDACFPDSVVAFRARDAATVEFVRGWLSLLQSSIEERAPESAQKNINLETLRRLEVPTPGIELQREFARLMAVVERCKVAQRRAIAEHESLFASLRHRAFRGEL